MDYCTELARAEAHASKLTSFDETKFVPVELHTTVVEEKKRLETELHELKAEDASSEIERWIEKSTTSGKMTPATVDIFRDMAKAGREIFAHACKLVEQNAVKAGPSLRLPAR